MTEKDKELSEEELENAVGGYEGQQSPAPEVFIDHDAGGQDMQRKIRRHSPPTNFEGFTAEQ